MFAKLSCVEIFRNERRDPLHWTQNPVLGHFGPFHYGTKIDAKLAEVVPLTHKFAKQTRVPIFRNERTRSTPLDPKLIFWDVSTVSLPHKSRCKTGRTGAINVQVW
jgi:hypothetical protein